MVTRDPIGAVRQYTNRRQGARLARKARSCDGFWWARTPKGLVGATLVVARGILVVVRTPSFVGTGRHKGVP